VSPADDRSVERVGVHAVKARVGCVSAGRARGTLGPRTCFEGGALACPFEGLLWTTPRKLKLGLIPFALIACTPPALYGHGPRGTEVLRASSELPGFLRRCMEAVVGAAPQVTGAREGGNGFGSQRPLIGPCETGHIPAQLWRPLGRSNPEGRFPEVYH